MFGSTRHILSKRKRFSAHNVKLVFHRKKNSSKTQIATLAVQSREIIGRRS